jgi:hypothetical protein
VLAWMVAAGDTAVNVTSAGPSWHPKFPKAPARLPTGRAASPVSSLGRLRCQGNSGERGRSLFSNAPPGECNSRAASEHPDGPQTDKGQYPPAPQGKPVETVVGSSHMLRQQRLSFSRQSSFHRPYRPATVGKARSLGNRCVPAQVRCCQRS